MKLIHLSDLHLGKRLNEVSLLEDQICILEKILRVIDAEAPQAVLLAGDIYDKSVPTAEAVQLFDRFLVQLAERGLQIFVISGNHDSPERLAFGGRLMELSGVHVSPVYDGTVEPILLEDEYGSAAVYLLPFLKPIHVRRFYPEAELDTYTDALRCAVSHMVLDPTRRNVLVTHQFVTGAERCDSEEVSVGGSDNVDVSVFDAFDYVALGHIHGPQSVGRETVRYCGTPLKYSFSECRHTKSVTVVELKEKGSVEIRTVPLQPRRELRELRGSFAALIHSGADADSGAEDYLRIILTDEEDVPDAMARLRIAYPNLMTLEYDNSRTRAAGVLTAAEDVERKSEMELFAEFFTQQNGYDMSEEQRRFCAALFDALKEAQQ